MRAVVGAGGQAVRPLQADDVRAPAAPGRGPRRPLPFPVRAAVAPGDGVVAVAAATGAVKAAGVQAVAPDLGVRLVHGARVEVELDVVEGPGGGLLGDGAAPASVRLAAVRLAVRAVVGNRAAVGAFSGRPATKPVVGAAGGRQVPSITFLVVHY